MKTLWSRLASAFGARPADEAIRVEAGIDEEGQGFTPRNALEQLLMAATGDPSKRVEFQQALLQSPLCAVTPQAPATPASRTLEADEHVSLLNVTAPDGTTVPAIFTSQDRIAEAFGPGAGFIEMNGADLLGMVVDAGAMLNPGLDYSVHWTAEDLAVLLGRPVRRTIEKETKVLLGSPAEPPVELIGELGKVLGADARIEAAWLALAQWADGGTSSWYLDVRTDLPPEAVNALLSDLFARVDFRGRPLDMVVNKPGDAEGAGIRIVPA